MSRLHTRKNSFDLGPPLSPIRKYSSEEKRSISRMVKAHRNKIPEDFFGAIFEDDSKRPTPLSTRRAVVPYSELDLTFCIQKSVPSSDNSPLLPPKKLPSRGMVRLPELELPKLNPSKLEAAKDLMESSGQSTDRTYKKSSSRNERRNEELEEFEQSNIKSLFQYESLRGGINKRIGLKPLALW